MTERELLYVKAIAECGSFSGAAKRLYMTQPSLSQCVANIERELGAPLFVRSTKGLTLTCAGEIYCRAAHQIMDIYEDMAHEINEVGELKRGKIKLGVPNYLSTWFLPHVLPKFHKQYPGIGISLLERLSGEIEEALLARQIDFALLNMYRGDFGERLPSLDFLQLRTDPFVIVAPKGSELGKYSVASTSRTGLRELDPVHLKNHEFILGMPGQRTRQVDDMILQKAGVVPKVLLTTRNYDTARRLACEGMGVTIVPWQYVIMHGGFDPDNYFVIPEYYEAGWTLCAVTVKDSYLPKACQAFIELCRDPEILREFDMI